MKKKFTYYLHDNCDHSERCANIAEQVGPLTEGQREMIGRPFYEVALSCEMDAEGNVTILGLKKK